MTGLYQLGGKTALELDVFAEKHKAAVDSKYLREFLPEWETVKWKKVKKSKMFLKEYVTYCGDYKLNIILAANNSKNGEEVFEEFEKFMRS